MRKFGFYIGKITNSIENAVNADTAETEISPLLATDLKKILKKNGWRFNWKMEFKPVSGDVYTIKKGTGYDASYSFLRIIKISGDSVMLYHNDLEYGGFVSKLTDDDYFVKDDTLVYKKKKLQEMLEQDEISSVKRGYGEGSGFNRVR